MKMIQLNKFGFHNLMKLNMDFDEDSTINNFVSVITDEFLTKLLSANEVLLDNGKITDGCNVFGTVRELN